MSENQLLPLPSGLLLPSNRQYRSTSVSPTRQRHTDEILSTLTPSAAIEAFRNPSGPLKECLDAAPLPEQSFAMRAALASKKIQDWLAELSSWPWPSGGGPAGFDPSASRGRTRSVHGDRDTFAPVGPEEPSVVGDKTWLGCLRASEVARYERRVDEIQQELDQMDMEGIKRHVLHNHILPLSRPGTPMSDSHRSTASSSLFYNKMDDMTALVTATVVQALPTLSKLTRLMNTWSIRLLLLRRVPSTLAYLDDAEIALRSGWNAIDVGRRRSIVTSTAADSPAAAAVQVPALSRKDFDVMKLVLEQKVSHAARAIDFMLDTLDGRQETVPDEWVDRMDKLERDYGDWVAVCERMLREAEWPWMARGVQAVPEQTPSLPEPDDPVERPSSSESTSTTIIRDGSSEDTETPLLPRLRGRDIVISSDQLSPPSSPPSMLRQARSRSASFSEMPPVLEKDEPDDETPPKTPLDSSFLEEDEAELPRNHHNKSPSNRSGTSDDDQLQQQISEILESIPAKIHLSSQPTPGNHLNPPDLQLPHLRPKVSTTFDRSQPPRSQSSMSSSSRAGTPSFLLAPAYARNTRSRAQRTNQDIKLYHLSRSNGEAPIKLFIRLVGEHGERVMVRVGGGWADLGEYLKEYAIHHGRRSKTGGESRVEVRDLPALPSKVGSSPASRPASALDSPITPLNVRKTRRSFGPDDSSIRQQLQMQQMPSQLPKTPLANLSPALVAEASGGGDNNTPSSEASTRSRSSSRLSWTEEDSSLGMSGPRTRVVEMSDESRAWVASVKEKVRIASGERRQPPVGGTGGGSTASPELFGEIGKVGGTKRLFRKG